MEPEHQNQLENEPENSEEVVHPWQSTQADPVVHVREPETPLTEPVAQPSHSSGHRLKRLFKSKKFWVLCVGVVLVAGAVSWFVQPARWWLMNALGVRNTLTITTISPGEGSKAKPSELHSVTVVVNGKTYNTDAMGKLRVSRVPYGQVNVVASKTGYQSVSYGVMLDFDPFFHKFGGQAQDDAARSVELSLTATGIPVAFKVTDALSGKPVTVGNFAIGDVVAKPDDQGTVSLKIPGTDASKVAVRASFGGVYVDKTFDITLGTQNQHVSVVPGGRHYYLSAKSGILTVYSSNIDGLDMSPIVTGTGQETDATAFAVSPDGRYGVLSSSRDGAHNERQDLLQRVYVVDLNTKQITRVDEAVNVAFADWSGDTLIYTTSTYDTVSNAYKITLRSVDTTSARVYNFESADNISVSTVAFNKVVYLKYINSGPDATTSPVLREAPVNGTTIQTLGEQVDYTGYIQLDFDRIAFKTGQDQAWHEYNFNTDELKSVTEPTSGSQTQQFLSTANDDGSERLLVDRINGRYALIVKDMASGNTRQLYSADGLSGPIRWVSSVVVFRVVNSQGAADYAVSLNGGDPHKIADVTAPANIQGLRFSFY